MNDTNSPMAPAFDLQRRTMERTQDTMHRTIEYQRQFATMAWEGTPAMEATDAGYDAMRTLVDSYFDAVESTLTVQAELSDDLRAAMHDGLGTMESAQHDRIEALEAAVRDADEPTDDLFEEILELFDEQFEAVLEAHEEIEDRTVESFDGFQEDIDDLQAAFDDLQEMIAEATSLTTDAAGESVDIHVDAVGESLEVIDGLGPTYAGRLRDRGFETLEALTEANADVVAETANVSVDQARAWIDAAQSSA